MIEFDSFKLSNGLRVIVHEDPSVSVAVMNILYDVGSRDEREDKTGFAHLFEHLMFGGSANISSFDTPLQQVGGENNAFTSPDITNYYLTVPASNLETGFWLESDRMMSLSFDNQVLEVQRKVVIEEFKQRYLNQPYGDAWLLLRPLAYKKHPYRWATIGKEISHIEQATMDDVKSFFYRHYRPNNAILVVAGNVKVDQVKRLSEKWFSPIEPGKVLERNLPQEPTQTEARKQKVTRNVPLSAIYKTFHMPARNSAKYHSSDLMSDILGRGKASRLYKKLVKDEKLFNSLDAYVTGSIDPGLTVVQGKVNQGVSYEDAEEALNDAIYSLKDETISEKELVKVKSQAEFSLTYGMVDVLNRATNLAIYTLAGETNDINMEADRIGNVSLQEIYEAAESILRPENSSTLIMESA